MRRGKVVKFSLITWRGGIWNGYPTWYQCNRLGATDKLMGCVDLTISRMTVDGKHDAIEKKQSARFLSSSKQKQRKGGNLESCTESSGECMVRGDSSRKCGCLSKKKGGLVYSPP